MIIICKRHAQSSLWDKERQAGGDQAWHSAHGVREPAEEERTNEQTKHP